MKGFQITFYTQQDRRHQGKHVADWLVALADELQLRGVTVIPASESIGKHHRVHSAHFFELSDQPVTIVFAVTDEEASRLFKRLRAEKLHLFYVKSSIEFGMTDEDDAD